MRVDVIRQKDNMSKGNILMAWAQNINVDKNKQCRYTYKHV